LRPFHAEEIAGYVKFIHETVRNAGRRAIFVVPPVLNEPRGTKIELIFDNALKRLSREVNLIDDTGKFQEEKWYAGDDEHPGRSYYMELGKELAKRGWLEPIGTTIVQ